MNRRPTVDSWYSAPGAKNAFCSPSKSETCVCMPLPGSPASGLGMNVAWTPCSTAISFTSARNVMTWSAIVRASA